MEKLTLDEAVEIMRSVPPDKLNVYRFKSCLLHDVDYEYCDCPPDSDNLQFCYGGWLLKELDLFDYMYEIGSDQCAQLQKKISGWTVNIQRATFFGDPELLRGEPVPKAVYQLVTDAYDQWETKNDV